MQVKNFACVCVRPQACICVCVRPRASASVCMRASAHRKLNVRTRLDAKKIQRSDASFVQGLSGCTIISVSELSGIRFSFPNIPVSEF